MEFTRGDTQPLKFQRLDASGNVIIDRPEKIFFTVKSDYKDKEFIFQKTINDMTYSLDKFWHFTIEPSDTQTLPVGTYVYDIEVTANGRVFTISKGQLKLLPEATWSSNK